MTSTMQTLIAKLNSEETTVAFTTMKKELTLDETETNYVDRYFKMKIDSLRESARDVCVDDDESELTRLLPHVWIEYRMEWTRLNAQMQYQTVMQGQAKSALIATGAALSFLISLIEPFLPIDEFYWCTKLAADPMVCLGSRTALASRVADIAGTGGVAGHKVMDRLVQLKDDLRSDLRDQLAGKKLDRAIEDVESLLTESMAMPTSDLSETLEMTLAGNLRSSSVPIVLGKDAESDDSPIPAETVAGLKRLFERWLGALMVNSMEPSIEARRKSGKTDAVQIQWKIRKGSSGRILLTVKDDGLGSMSAPPEFDLPSDWVVSVQNDLGRGSSLTVNFRSSQHATMMHFGVARLDKLLSIAIPIANVVSIAKDQSVQVRAEGSLKFAADQDDILPFVDLSELLIEAKTLEKTAKSENRAFVKVKTSNAKQFYLSVDEIYEQVRGASRSGPSMVPFIEVYLLIQGKPVAVIDIDLLDEAMINTAA